MQAVDVELSRNHRRPRQDLIQTGIDLAIRFGKLPDSSALARFVGCWPLVVAASPSYLTQHGTPEILEELSSHRFMIAGPVAGKGLTFKHDGRQVTIQPQGRLAINGANVAVSAVRAGLGVAVARLPAFSRELGPGELIRVLPGPATR